MSETTENDYPDLSPAFHDAARLRRIKRDYGGIKEYFPFGNKSFVQMIHVKTQRLVNLNKKDIVPENESIDDNLLDLINYASYYYEWRKGILDE
jgi:hypothetical protein